MHLVKYFKSQRYLNLLIKQSFLKGVLIAYSKKSVEVMSNG